MADFIHDLACVIHGAVVGAELNNRQAERAFFTDTIRGNLLNLLAQVALFEAVGVNPADKAVRVAGSFQINRCGTSLN